MSQALSEVEQNYIATDTGPLCKILDYIYLKEICPQYLHMTTDIRFRQLKHLGMVMGKLCLQF